MAIESLGSVSGTGTNVSAATSVNLEDFVRILVSQLTNQDPLKPMDNQEFITQLAQFTSLEQSRQFNANLESLLTVQATSQSVGLLGRRVDLRLDSGVVTGVVERISFASGQPLLQVAANGTTFSQVRISQIVTVE